VQVESPFYWNVMRVIHPWCMSRRCGFRLQAESFW
jgi:hypothetical protein